MQKLPDFCEGCPKKHTIQDDGETCLVYFTPPHIYISNNECPFNPIHVAAPKVKRVNPLKAAKRAKRGESL